MQSWTDSLFYIAFLGQIYVISYYFPEKILARMKYVIDTYPPSKYPKLYPKPAEYYVIGQWKYRAVNRFIAAFGLGLLFAIIFVVDHSTFADDGFISEAWPAFYGMLQFLPLIVLEMSEYSQIRQMKKANLATTRQADLRPRRLLNFVSPTLVGATVLFFVAMLYYSFYVNDFVFSWNSDTTQMALVVTATNVLFLVIGGFTLYGRKQNPHQATEDRSRHIGASLRSMFFVSIAMSIFFITRAADDAYNLDSLDATIMSVYFQVIVFLSLGHLMRSLRLEDVNFDVYKDGVAAG